MVNVTYYIGAGASIAALPVYSNFKERLQLFNDYIFHYERDQDEKFKTCSAHYREVLSELIDALDNTQNSTLDILAHELKEKHNSNGKLKLSTLKYLISDFFVFEQLIKKHRTYPTQLEDDEIIGLQKNYDAAICQKVNTSIDPRYKNFILPHLTGSSGQLRKLQKEIKVISWNYDLQFELSYASTVGCSIDLAQQNLQVYPSPGTVNGIDLDSSAIIKLNGTAGIYYPNNNRRSLKNSIYERELTLNAQYLEIMVTNFYNNRLRVFDGLPFFKFYFEDNNPFHIEALDYAKNILKSTKTLIVVGYTFHPSNRSIDKAVFSEATNIENVILQVLPTDFDKVKHNLTRVNPVLQDRISPYPFLDDFAPLNNI